MKKKLFNATPYQWVAHCRTIILVVVILLTGIAGKAQVADEDSTELLEDSASSYTAPAVSLFDPQSVDDTARFPVVTVRMLPDTTLAAIRKDPDFWYADSAFKGQPRRTILRGSTGSGKPPSQSSGSSSTQSYNPPRSGAASFLWILVIIGFVAILFLFLFNQNVNPFGKRNRKLDRHEDVDEAEVFRLDTAQAKINEAEAAGNYRLAIRLMFLQTLALLNDTRLIQLKTGSTNFDYLVQMEQSPYYPDFFRLVRNYEYAWYGQFAVSPETYGIIKKDFQQFKPTNRS